MTLSLRSAVFVSARAYLGGTGPSGGVQICTREYQQTLEAVGYTLRVVSYDPDRRILTRVRRVIDRRPYANLLPPGLADRIVREADGAAAVFLNQVDLMPLAGELRKRLPPSCALVLLSHGLESVDHLHMFRARSSAQPFAELRPRDERLLGRLLVTECEARAHIDQVFCLAPFEVEIERWLGSRRVEWLPRTVTPDPLPWKPVPGRLGFVGTLNHPPNREGLELFLAALASRIGSGPSPLHVRLVGGPADAARGLTDKYPWVEYLGPLPDPALRSEAATWASFLHPLFCFARGCSTKLAVGLGWGIPVLTTPQGHRGYEWREGQLATADTPAGMARLAETTMDLSACEEMRSQVQLMAGSTPSLSQVATRVRNALDSWLHAESATSLDVNGR